MLELVALGVVGLGVLLVVAVGSSQALLGGPYRASQADLDAIGADGVVPANGSFEGQVAGIGVGVEPWAGGLRVHVRGVPMELTIEDDGDELRMRGLPDLRPRRKALEQLHERIQRAVLTAVSGGLTLTVPPYVARQGQLPSVIESLAAFLERNTAPVAWDEVALDRKENRCWRIEGLTALLATPDRLAAVASKLEGDPDRHVLAVREAVLGRTAPLVALLADEPPADVAPLVRFLPPELRGEVLASRVAFPLSQAQPFVADLAARRADGGAPLEELRRLGDALFDELSVLEPAMGQQRFTCFEGTFEPFAYALEAVAAADGEAPEGWVALCVDLLAQAEGSHADALLDALDVAARPAHLPFVRQVGPRAGRIVARLESEGAVHRGVLSLVEAEGGGVALAEPGRPRHQPE